MISELNDNSGFYSAKISRGTIVFQEVCLVFFKLNLLIIHLAFAPLYVL